MLGDLLVKLIGVLGYTVSGLDGDIGSVAGYYFDDNSWSVRYLLINTGEWLPKRKILVSPEDLVDFDEQNKRMSVNLTKKKIKNGPAIEADKPMLREAEERMADHFSWTKYWMENNGVLRASKELIGSMVSARDGKLGHLIDFAIDVEHWALQSLVVDAWDLFPGKKLLLAPGWVERINMKEKEMLAGFFKQQIVLAFEPEGKSSNSQYREILYDFYKRTVAI